MTRRARLIAVVATLAAGALGIVASTQTWLLVSLTDGGDPLPVSGAAAMPVLAPLSLTVLAMGAALSIVGLVLRYVFGALTVVAGAVLAVLTAQAAYQHPASAIAGTVTAATGITGEDAVAALVAEISATVWPAVTLVGWIALIAAGVLTLATAHAWRRTGRRYSTAEAPLTERVDPASPDEPLDAIDSWDDLSRGSDPTGGPR